MSIEDLLKSRRTFLKHGSLGLAAAAVGCHAAPEPEHPAAAPPAASAGPPAPGTPPAFGTAPPVGPEVSGVTFEESKKLVRVSLTTAEATQGAEDWREA